MNFNKKLFSLFLILIMLFVSLTPSKGVVAVSTNSDVDQQVEEIMSKMTLEEKVGQMLMPDFRNWDKDENGKWKPFTEMNDEVKKIIEDYNLGGVILFRENVANTEQTTRLVHGLQEASPEIPLLITIDQEGGLVTRLQTGTNMPGNMALGATRDQAIAEEVGRAIGEELNSLGINVNFAPTLDVNTNPDNPVIGIRSFGSDPDLVSKMGVGYIKGLQKANVAATAKHFPGHGDTATDSHLGLPIVNHDRETLNSIDLKPFKEAMDNDIDMIMTAHIVVPALDDDKVISKKDGKEIGIPATLSHKILTELVRDEMKYDGVLVTDALGMKAISENFGPEDAVIRSIKAGVDILLMPTTVWENSQVENLDKVYRAILAAIENEEITEDRIDESVKRILTLKINRNIIGEEDTRTLDEKIKNAKTIVGSKEHKEIERRAAENAITLIKNEDGVLPFKLEEGKEVLLLSSYEGRLNLMELQLNNIIKELGLKEFKLSKKVYTSTDNIVDEDKELIDAADFIVMDTMNINAKSNYPIEASKYALEKNKNLVTMSTRNPYDIAYLPDVKANIAVYGSSGYDQTQQGEAALPINIPVGLDVIFGLVNPTGKLPVSIPKADRTGNLYEFGYGLVYEESDMEYPLNIGNIQKTEKDGKLDIKIDVENHTEEPIDSVVILKVFDNNGREYKVEYKDIKVNGKNSTVEFELDTTNYPKGIKGAKAYIWDSLDNMKPLADVMEQQF